MFETEDECPKCGSEIKYDLTCPTYTVNGRRYRCMPSCGDARVYFCVKCDWEYTEGLDLKHPAYEANEKRKPDWLSTC